MCKWNEIVHFVEEGTGFVVDFSEVEETVFVHSQAVGIAAPADLWIAEFVVVVQIAELAVDSNFGS